jgi:hypothetical protein
MITVVYFWQIKKVFLPIAILFMAFHKFALMRLPGVSFVKLLGTGKGESFTPKDANPYRWGVLVTIKETHLDIWIILKLLEAGIKLQSKSTEQF